MVSLNRTSDDNGNANNQQQQQPNGIEIDLDQIVRNFDQRTRIYEDAIALSTLSTNLSIDESPYCTETAELKRVDFVLVYQKSINDNDDAENPLNHEMIRRKFEV